MECIVDLDGDSVHRRDRLDRIVPVFVGGEREA